MVVIRLLKMEFYHRPVLVKEVLKNLIMNPKGSYIDCTCGEGGHSYEIAKILSNRGVLICVDKDSDVLEKAKVRLSEFKNVYFVNEGFENIDKISVDSGIEKFDGILLDLGVSMYHYVEKSKGFSFDSEYPLTMTYARADRVEYTAYRVVNGFSRKKLAEVIFKYGEEPLAGRIANAIVEYRKKKRIETPKELAEVISKAVGKYYKSRIHPATKTFMAIRIFVNREYEVLETFISKVKDFVSSGGRVCFITFHSGEDRIVKLRMREMVRMGEFRMVNDKPIIPTKEEIRQNYASRSAKLRVYEKV
ncbi:MAG: 16S rRNA (cytosine(1402)-N(4))-methyltransferase RsmH [Brevinematia bacterium]